MKDPTRKLVLCKCEACCEEPATLILELQERKGSREPEVFLECAACFEMTVWDGDYPPESVQFHGGAEVTYSIIDGQVWGTRRVTE